VAPGHTTTMRSNAEKHMADVRTIVRTLTTPKYDKPEQMAEHETRVLRFLEQAVIGLTNTFPTLDMTQRAPHVVLQGLMVSEAASEERRILKESATSELKRVLDVAKAKAIRELDGDVAGADEFKEEA
jgi:hypothetical protein